MSLEVIIAELAHINQSEIRVIKLNRKHVYRTKQELNAVQKRFVAIYGLKKEYELWLSYKDYGRKRNADI